MNQSKRLTVAGAAEYVGLAVSTLNKLRMTNLGPRFLKISDRRVVYDSADLDAWLESRRRTSTSDAGALEASAT